MRCCCLWKGFGMNESEPEMKVCPHCGNATPGNGEICEHCGLALDATPEEVEKIREQIERLDKAINYRKFQLECEERRRREKEEKEREEQERAREDREDLVKRSRKLFSPARSLLRHKIAYSDITTGRKYSVGILVIALVLQFLPPGFIISDILLRKQKSLEKAHWLETGERFRRSSLIAINSFLRYCWYAVILVFLSFFAMEGAGLWSPLQILDRYLPAIINRLPF